MARRLVEREARSGCRPAPQHPLVQDLHEFAATASPRRATRCDARVPEQPPVLRQRIQKTQGTTPDLGELARGRPDDPPAGPSHARSLASRHSCPRPLRRPTRGPQSRAKPRVTPLVTISDWRYLLRRHHVTTPALWAGRLSLKGPCLRIDRKTAGLSRHRTTRSAPARRRPGPAPIVVGSRWRVGRPRSRFPRRRRRGLHDGVAMNAPRSCCSERRRRAGLGRRTGASGRRAVSHTARKVQAGESRIGADASADVPWPARARRSPPRRLQFAQPAGPCAAAAMVQQQYPN